MLCIPVLKTMQAQDQNKKPRVEKKKLLPEHFDNLTRFLEYVKDNNFVITLVVEDNGTAYQIFETLNYRGRELSKSNLIKNHVLSKINNNDKKQRDISTEWNQIFDEIINGERDDVFILESLRSRLGSDYDVEQKESKPSLRNLFKIVSKEIKNERKAEQYVKWLKEDAMLLDQLYKPRGSVDSETKDDFNTIRTLKAKHIRAPILAAHRKWFNNKERRRDYEYLTKFLVKFFFNVKIIRNLHAGRLEDIMLETIKLINNNETLSKIIETLQGYDKPDAFKNNFKEFMQDPPKNNVTKYVLRQITIHMDIKHSDVRPDDDLTLEHILPQTYKKWDTTEFFKNYPDNKIGTGGNIGDFVDPSWELDIIK